MGDPINRAAREERRARHRQNRQNDGGPKNNASVVPTPPSIVGPISPAPDTSYISILSSIFPHLSPEDQKALGKTYGIPTPAESPGQSPPIKETGGEITGQVRNTYLSSERANRALTALNALPADTQKGPGFVFLRNALALLQKYGGASNNGMSRANYGQMSLELSGLLENATAASVAPYKDLAKAFLSPTFIGGQLMQQQKSGIYGSPNKKLFT